MSSLRWFLDFIYFIPHSTMPQRLKMLLSIKRYPTYIIIQMKLSVTRPHKPELPITVISFSAAI